MIRVLIADDERPARMRLRELLAPERDVEIIGEAADGAEAIDLIERDAPDLVLLDIEMPELDGFGVLASLAEEKLPLVIFVTAFDHYAVRAFEAEAVDYVTKPVSRERLSAALDRARRRAGTRDDAVARLVRQRPAERLAVRVGDRTRIVDVSAIDWIAAASNYVEVFAGAERYLIRTSLNDLESRLPSDRFARIHRSVIVNVERIVELRPAANRGDAIVLIRGGKELPLSRSYRDRLSGIFDTL